MAYPIQQLADGRVRMSDGSIVGSLDQARGYTLTPLTSNQQAGVAADPFASYSFSNTGSSYSNLPSARVVGQPTQQTTSPTPTQPTEIQPSVDEEAQRRAAELRRQIDELYNPTFDYLGKLESTVQQDYPSVKGDIESQYQTAFEDITGRQEQAQQSITEAERQAGMRKESALSAAKRLYNEMTLGARQRFGGASPIGEGYQALLGRELQRNRGSIQSSYSTTMDKILFEKQNLEREYRNSLRALDREKVIALNEAQRAYQERLLEVERLKTETQAAKAAQKLNVLQEFRNQIFAIEAQSKQLQNALYNQKQQDSDLLDQYAQTELQALKEAETAVTSAQLPAYYRSDLETSPSASGGWWNDIKNWVGQLYNKDEEEK